MFRTGIGVIALLLASSCFAQSGGPLLLQYPSVSATKIVFVYGDDLWQILRDGGVAERLTSGTGGKSHPCLSPHGSQIAYVPLNHAFEIWKHYRGGRASPIWLARLSDSSVAKIPRENSNDFNPIWIDHRIFFLSDRNGPMSLFVYDTNTKAVSEAL